MWRSYTGVIHCVFDPDSEPTKLLYKEGRGPQTDKHLPPSTVAGKFLRKADI